LSSYSSQSFLHGPDRGFNTTWGVVKHLQRHIKRKEGNKLE
jgi:hypothetical protein